MADSKIEYPLLQDIKKHDNGDGTFSLSTYSENAGGGGGGDASADNQVLQTAVLESIDAKTNSKGLYLEFSDIADAPVVPATDLAGWNTYFFGAGAAVFQAVNVEGNCVVLYGTSGHKAKSGLFQTDTTLVSFLDDGIFNECGDSFCQDATALVSVSLQDVIRVGNCFLAGCSSLANFKANKLALLGTQTGIGSAFVGTALNDVFLPECVTVGAYFLNTD